MSYQRISEPCKPNGYIYMGFDGLHFITTDHEKKSCFDNSMEVVFTDGDTTTAESLFVALYDHLKANGRSVRFNKKTGELKFVQERKKR
jgi:hypothetical protein